MFISITLIIVFTYFYVKHITDPNKKGNGNRFKHALEEKMHQPA